MEGDRCGGDESSDSLAECELGRENLGASDDCLLLKTGECRLVHQPRNVIADVEEDASKTTATFL
jgi:hypothetical protein